MNIYRKQKRLKPSEDPYKYLLLGVLRQALSDIRCYYLDRGMDIEKKNGKIAVRWIRSQQGLFPLITEYFELEDREIPPDNFHRWCINIIEKYKQGTSETDSMILNE